MGKNFSCNNLGQRKASDFYETPYSLTAQLLQRERLEGGILEPACGNGAIVSVLKEHGYSMITAYDAETNFLAETRRTTTIITNPPYSLAQEFILRAKQVATEKIIFLLPLAYLHGKKRYDTIWLDKEFPLAKIYVFTRYPMLGEPLRADGKYHTGMVVFMWAVWDKQHSGPPTIDWIDNNMYVIGKGD